jgi:hypothetical protein
MNESELQNGQAKSRWKAGLALFIFLWIVPGGLFVQMGQFQHLSAWSSLGFLLLTAAFPWSAMILFLAFRRRLPVWLPITSLFFVIAGWFAGFGALDKISTLGSALPVDNYRIYFVLLPISGGIACAAFAFCVWLAFVPVLKSRRKAALKSSVLGSFVLGILCGLLAFAYPASLPHARPVFATVIGLGIFLLLPLLLVTATTMHYFNEANQLQEKVSARLTELPPSS